MPVIETNHDEVVVHESLTALAQSILDDIPEDAIECYFDNEGDFLVFTKDFVNQPEDVQIRLLKRFEEDLTFEIID